VSPRHPYGLVSLHTRTWRVRGSDGIGRSKPRQLCATRRPIPSVRRRVVTYGLQRKGGLVFQWVVFFPSFESASWHALALLDYDRRLLARPVVDLYLDI